MINLSVENSVRLIKKVHPTSVLLVKIGNFYHAYGKDAYILSYFFDYKIENKGYKTCGFPLSSLNKVIVQLENQKIDYMVLDRKDNYEVLQKEEYKKENTYDTVYPLALMEINVKNRINELNEYLINNIHNKEVVEKIKKLEELLYEE